MIVTPYYVREIRIRITMDVHCMDMLAFWRERSPSRMSTSSDQPYQSITVKSECVSGRDGISQQEGDSSMALRERERERERERFCLSRLGMVIRTIGIAYNWMNE